MPVGAAGAVTFTGGGCTAADAVLVALTLPSALPAVTTTRMFSPESAATVVYVAAVAPGMFW